MKKVFLAGRSKKKTVLLCGALIAGEGKIAGIEIARCFNLADFVVRGGFGFRIEFFSVSRQIAWKAFRVLHPQGWTDDDGLPRPMSAQEKVRGERATGDAVFLLLPSRGAQTKRPNPQPIHPKAQRENAPFPSDNLSDGNTHAYTSHQESTPLNIICSIYETYNKTK